MVQLKRLWLTISLLMLCGGLFAANTWFEKSRNFSAYSLGQGKVHFKVLVFACGSTQNHWAAMGTDKGDTYIYATGSGVTQKILSYRGDNSNNGKNKYMGWVYLEVKDGTVVITNTYDQTPKTLYSGDNREIWLSRTGESDHPTFLEFDWYPSTAFDGKEYTAKAHIVDTRKTGATWLREWSLGSYSAASIQAPTLFDPVFYSVGENGVAGLGHVMIPYVVYQEPTSYYTSYTGSGTRINATERSGQLFVMTCDTVQHDFNATFTVKRDGGQTQEVTSNTISIPAFHRIYDFRAAHLQRKDGTIDGRYTMLTWAIRTPGETDIMSNDMFQIQRAYEQDFSDAETLGLVVAQFDSTHAQYCYIDSTEGALFNRKHRGQPIYYRVNRASTTNWGYEDHAWVAIDSIAKNNSLLTLLSDSVYYTKNADFERTRKITMKIRTQKENEYVYWDNNAEVVIKRTAITGNDTLFSERRISGVQFKRLSDSSYYTTVDLVADVPCADYTYTVSVDDSQSDLNCGNLPPIVVLGPDLYYTDAASIASFDASKGYYADHIFLQWNQTEGNADSFRIERRPQNSTGAWSEIVTLTGDYYHKDRTAVAGQCYDYRIICAYSCNGTTLQDTAYAYGWLSTIGSISGRISYPNGTGNAGVEVKAVPQGSAIGIVRGCLYANKAATIATAQPIRWSEVHTYQLLVKAGEASNAVSKLLSSDTGVELRLEEQNQKLVFQYGSQTTETPIQISHNTWVALAVVLDTDSNQVHLYFDGKPIYSAPIQNTAIADSPLYLLKDAKDVYIDEVRIWNRALTNQEIAANTHYYLSGKEEGLLCYYTFDNVQDYPQGSTTIHHISNMAYSATNYVEHNDILLDTTQADILTTGTPSEQMLTYAAVSDKSGSYCIGGVPFGTGATYDITPTAEHGTFTYNGTSAGFAAISLDPKRPEATGIDFVNTDAVRFTGRVLYRRSTIPVRGAHFLVNGVLATDATGNAIETNAAGNFEFEVPKAPITVQVVMDGHRFANDGYFIIDGDSLFTPTANMDGLRMWDETKVRLIGRIAGGSDQGELPLGFSLSRNNLGDSITLVLELEGDNTAQIVYDPQDKTLDRIDTTMAHVVGDYHTDVAYMQKRIMVYPDQTTGEFFVDLFPVKYKLTQITAQGYSTLTNANTGMQVLDLTNRLTTNTLHYDNIAVACNDTFLHIYHSPVSISLTQLQYGIEMGYLGIEKTYITDMDSVQHLQEVVRKNANGQYEYLFGNPIFPEGKYTFRISAHEDYYYNGNRTQGKHDRVMMRNHKVQIYNGMHSETQHIDGVLDANGKMDAVLIADYPTYTRLGDDATRKILISVEHHGEYVQSDPTDVYVFADRLSGTESVGITPIGIRLFDILRDPPGANSYSSLASGATYQKSSKYHLNVEAGIKLDMAFGTNYTGIVGAVAAPAGVGTFTGVQIQTSSATPASIPLTFKGIYDWTYPYQYTTSEAIRTGSDAYHVGANADVYIGTTEIVYHGIGHGMAVLDSVAYAAMSAQVKDGTLKLISSARNSDGQMRYLVVARKLLYAFGNNTNFVYTQEHILTTVIPTLLRERNNHLLTTDSLTAQRQANTTKQRVYYTALSPTDDTFGAENYHWADPQNAVITAGDTIAAYNRMITQWLQLIAMNEQEKVQAINRNQIFKTHSITGGTPVTYSETVSYGRSFSSQYATPSNLFNSTSALSINIFNGTSAQQLVQLIEVLGQGKDAKGNSAVDIEAKTTGSKFKLSIKPITNIDFNHVGGESQSTSRTYSYTLSPDAYGYMDVNVYRVKDTINSFNAEADDSRAPSTDYCYSSFIFYGVAGASRCPYEGGDSTHVYNPGTPLSNPTIPIEDPHITVDKRMISDVPADQKAVFTLAMSNEQPTDIGAAALAVPFEIYVVPASNPNGLKLSIDGVSIGFTPAKISLPHGKTVHKVLEVERGQGYDFEDVRLRLRSTCNIDEYDEVAISVHFVPAATAINLSAPHDQWVLNTRSSRDSAGYYMPVVIDGFDIHSDGFDHIELQYKQLTQSDNDWVNLCSYYADDSLFAQASGNKAMIENGKIDNIRFYGERDPMEQNYDLRAVSFARYGNGFVTRSSAVLHGKKDTRCPEVFGLPTPADGILSVKEVLSLRFSEPIAGNYLDEDANFEIVGGTNNLDITQTTSLSFSGEKDCVAKTQVHRNMNHRPFTIEALIRPAEHGKAMTIFSLGDTKQKLRFSLTADNRLQAEVGKATATSAPLEPIQDFTRCAVTYDTDGQVHFYAGTKDMTLPNQPTLPIYTGNGTLLFGNTTEGEEPFHGNMLEARLWSKALAQDELSLTYKKHLTGYEKELVAYYPMNEGMGNTCTDHANGATLRLQGTSWTLPAGMSIRLQQGEGLRLNQDILSRSAIQDWTLMLWFKTDTQTPDTAALFATGGGIPNEDDAQGKMLLMLANGNIVLRHQGQEYTAHGQYADNQWHHLIYIVNRAYNIANIFVDGKQAATFAADRIGSMASNEMWIGACHWTLTDTLGNRIPQPLYPFSGHIDQLVLYEQALPNSTIQTYCNVAPNGDEMGLIAYLPFATQQLSDNGRLELRYSPYNARIFRDANGQEVDKKQLLLLTNAAAMTDKNDYAPIRDYTTRTRYNFAWACNNDELMINLKMLDKEINKQNVFITLRNVEDLNGNRMLNPISWTVYVDRNQLRWSQNEITVNTQRNSSAEFDLTISNTGGTTRQYQLTSLPSWLTAVPASGTLAPQATQTIHFTIAEGINVGEHTEYIYLQDDQDLIERLLLTVKVESICPWKADSKDLPMSMSLVGQVLLTNGNDTTYDTDTDDIIAAFISNRCVGLSHITYNDATLDNHVYMTIYGNTEMQRQPVQLRLWQASTGKIYLLNASTNLVFEPKRCYGCNESGPVLLTTSERKIQQLLLNEGWNWTSFHVKPTYSTDINRMLSTQATWTAGDMVKDIMGRSYSQYQAATSNRPAAWYGTLNRFNYRNIYMFYADQPVSPEIEGEPLTEQDRMLHLFAGWNVLPYLLDVNQPLAEAMADYLNNAKAGDVLKSKDRFAVFSAASKWEGNLTYMEAGQGYLLYRTGEPCTFTYYAYNASQPRNIRAKATESSLLFTNRASSNMSLIATLADWQGETDNLILSAYAGSQVVGQVEVHPTDSLPLFFLTIGSEQPASIHFSLEQNGKTIAQSAPMLNYKANGIVGSLENPYPISFRQHNVIALPSPFVDHAQIVVSDENEQPVSIAIYSAGGQLITYAEGQIENGTYIYQWQAGAALPTGIYSAVVRLGNQTQTVKLIKQ